MDSGVGISKEFLPHVFDRFRQADSSITRLHGGLGLGLAIVRNLVELHGGSVQAFSDGEGQGTTFTIVLPVGVDAIDERQQTIHEESSIQSAITQSEMQYPNLNGLRILVVDDEKDALEMITIALTRFGADVKALMSTMDAIELLSQWKPNVLVSDIGMPDEDGYAFIGRVRSLHPDEGGSVPAAALTAYARHEDKQRALAAGYQVHIEKPVDIDQMAEVISSLVNRS